MPGGPVNLATQDPRQAFILGVARATGLRQDVVAGWVRAESGSSSTGAFSGFNFLNLSAKGSTGWSGVPIAGSYASSGGTGSFAKFNDVGDAITETSWWINHMGNFASIRASAGKPATVQLGAIARSPWDAGHYGGNGQNLVGAYKAETHDPLSGIWSAVSGGASAVAHPIRSVQHAEQAVVGGIFHAVMDVVLLVAALALIFMGVRRLAGDRGPSPSELARIFKQDAAAAAPLAVAA